MSRFMKVCHSNETKLGLKKIQEQSPGIIYQKILTSSINFAELQKITNESAILQKNIAVKCVLLEYSSLEYLFPCQDSQIIR